MRKTLTIIAVTLLASAGWTGTAAAQDGPTITVEPATVDAAGETEFTITGSGWTAAPPIFVLPCEAPESGDPADVDSATCDTANLTPATPADGSFEVTATFDVPEGGLAIAAGDAAQTEAAAAVVTVGADEAPAEGEDGAAEDDGAAEGDDDAAAEGDDGGELAETGVESMLLVIVAMAIMAAGAMVLRATRRTV
ncbi:MAG: hypothetical protein ACE367_01820 [Acidimicrobiales bacterium]